MYFFVVWHILHIFKTGFYIPLLSPSSAHESKQNPSTEAEGYLV